MFNCVVCSWWWTRVKFGNGLHGLLLMPTQHLILNQFPKNWLRINGSLLPLLKSLNRWYSSQTEYKIRHVVRVIFVSAPECRDIVLVGCLTIDHVKCVWQYISIFLLLLTSWSYHPTCFQLLIPSFCWLPTNSSTKSWHARHSLAKVAR